MALMPFRLLCLRCLVCHKRYASNCSTAQDRGKKVKDPCLTGASTLRESPKGCGSVRCHSPRDPWSNAGCRGQGHCWASGEHLPQHLAQTAACHCAWVVRAMQHTWKDVLFRDLWHESKGNDPYFRSAHTRGTLSQLQSRGIKLEALPHAVYCVLFQNAKAGDGAAQYLRRLFGDTQLLTPPSKGKTAATDAPFEHKATINTVPQGLQLQPIRTGEVTETAIDDEPDNPDRRSMEGQWRDVKLC